MFNRLASSLSRRHGGIDVLINNAGVSYSSKVDVEEKSVAEVWYVSYLLTNICLSGQIDGRTDGPTDGLKSILDAFKTVLNARARLERYFMHQKDSTVSFLFVSMSASGSHDGR